MNAERTRDPAAHAMRDRDIARVFEDGTPMPRAITRRIRAQAGMGVPEESIRTPTKGEAQTLAAALNALPLADRAALPLALRGEFGGHNARALAELAAEGLTLDMSGGFLRYSGGVIEW